MRVPVENSLYTEEELLKMSKKRAVDGLSEKVQRFCEYYVEGHNRKMALKKAGFSQGTIEGAHAFLHRRGREEGEEGPVGAVGGRGLRGNSASGRGRRRR